MARRRHNRFVRLSSRLDLGSPAEAAAAVAAGRVTVNGAAVTNLDALVAADAVVAVRPQRVLRGTVKLRVALSRFAIEISGSVCVDVGAAAGGFTTALLEAGARRVYAVDAGYGQLDGRLRQDRRVVNLERTNLAELGPDLVPEAVDLLTVDLSYLALADAVPQLAQLTFSGRARLIALVKPTFELHAPSLIVEADAVEKAHGIAVAACERCGWSIDPGTVPVEGGGGAAEVFICGSRRVAGD